MKKSSKKMSAASLHTPPESIYAYNTIITVMGAGGGGNNTINRLIRSGLKGIYTIAVNTDAQDLLASHADRKILIGKNITGGLGAGGDPEIGERSAEECKDILMTALEGTDMLFITCGLGGGTGTGSLPVIADIARNQGILTIAIVTMPFSDEGIIRWENAQVGLEKLKKVTDTVIVMRNDRLLELVSDLPLDQAFEKGDEILVEALSGLSNLVLKKGLINLDFADVSVILRDGPDAVIGMGASDSENRVEESVNRAITHPMLEIGNYRANSVLIYIAGGPDMTLKEARQAIQFLSQKLDPSARIIWGLHVEKNLKRAMKVLIILTGLQKLEEEINEAETYQIEELDLSSANLDKGKNFKIDEPIYEDGKSIFDIKESIFQQGESIESKPRPTKAVTKTTKLFYKILEEEAMNDLKRFERSIHFLRENLENRKALMDAKQSCKLLQASAQMFGFDEISQLLSSIGNILGNVQSRDLKLTPKVLDSLSLAMEMVVDLIENQSDGYGETGYIVDRLRELKEERFESTK